MWTYVYVYGEKQRKWNLGEDRVLNSILSLGKFWNIKKLRTTKMFAAASTSFTKWYLFFVFILLRYC